MSLQERTAQRGYILQIFGNVGDHLTMESASNVFKTIAEIVEKYGIPKNEIQGCQYHGLEEENILEPYLDVRFSHNVPARRIESLRADINSSSLGVKSVKFVNLPTFRQNREPPRDWDRDRTLDDYE